MIRLNIDGTTDTLFDSQLHSSLLTTLNGNPTNTGASSVMLDTNVQIYDAELQFANSYSGATLTLVRHGGADATDVFSAKTGGTLSTLTSGSYFSVSATTIGLVVNNANGVLQIGFNANATQALVSSAMQQIAYATTASVPSALAQIDWTFDDGNTTAQGTGGALSVTGSTVVTNTVRNVNPVLVNALPDVTVVPGQYFARALPNDTFADANAGDPLRYTVAMANSTALPTWLMFDPATRTFSGNPGSPGMFDVKQFDITVTARDVANVAVSDMFRLSISSPNSLPAGTVTLAGTPTQGQTLTAANTLADADTIPASGIGALAYQWQADGSAISGATGSSFTLTQTQVGKAITVKASYIDGQGTAESVSSNATTLVANLNDVPTGSVTFGGTPMRGQVLTAAQTLADLDGIPISGTGSITWQWLADGSPISGATSTSFTLTTAQVGKTMTVQVSYTDNQNTVESVTSVATAAVANANVAPTGGVTISGSVTQNQTLTASHTLADADGVPSSGAGAFSYQWLAAGSEITGATAASLTLTQAQVGKVITARVSYTDLAGYTESMTSNATAAVANVNDLPTGTVTISGNATQGQTLSANNTLADPDGLPASGIGAISYQWLAGGTVISSATGATFTLTQAQVGKTIAVKANYVDSGGYAGNVISSATAAVVNVNDSPTGSVTLSGTPIQGEVLTASQTLVDIDGIPTSGTNAISYQWLAGSTVIAGVTGASFTLTQAQVGQAITVKARYTDNQGTVESMSSTATAVVSDVNDLATGSVSISGTAAQGRTLTVANTLADADGIPASGIGAVSYQWMADGAAITGATSTTLTLTQAEVGSVLSVKASYTDSQGTPEGATSSPTAVVANVNDAPTGSVTISGSATDGQVLTVSHTLADADGLGTVGYQWFAGAQAISGATSAALALTQALVGQPIAVRALYTDGGGTAEAVGSAATSPVVGLEAQLEGLVYHWKSHALLSSATVQVRDDTAVAADAGLFDLRAASYNPDTSRLSVEVWANASAAVESFDFRAVNSQASAASFTSALPGADWTVLVNADNPTQVSVGAYLSNLQVSGATGAFKLGTLALTLPAGGSSSQTSFDGIYVGSTAAQDQALSLAAQDTGASGHYQFGLHLGGYTVLVDRSTTDSGSAVTSADALAALRMAIGLNPNTDPDGAGPLSAPAVSPYQFMAADVNATGTVTSADALAILRMAVNFSTALPQAWLFVEETRDFWNEATQSFSLTRQSALWDRDISVGLTQDQSVNLVGLLKGDVNGSWSAPAGSADLDVIDPGYFQNLATLTGAPVDQWGL